MKILAAALLFAASVWAQSSSAELAIRQVMAEQVEAWNRGDVESFMTGYERSPETAFVGTEVLKGYDAVLARYRSKYSNRDQMGRLHFSDIEVRMLGEDHAFVIGRFHLTRNEAGGGDASGIFTLVFRKTPDGWKIIADHTS